MIIPKRLRSVSEADIDIKAKVEEMIENALNDDCIGSWPIELLSIKHLELLGEYAKENDILVTIKAEHSNVHQGVLVNLIRKNLAEDYMKFL